MRRYLVPPSLKTKGLEFLGHSWAADLPMCIIMNVHSNINARYVTVSQRVSGTNLSLSNLHYNLQINVIMIITGLSGATTHKIYVNSEAPLLLARQ